MAKVLSASKAAALDASLMSTLGYSLEQLMELAGLSVASSVLKSYPTLKSADNKNNNVLVICGPGNNGGDGLVAARHLKLFGFNPVVYIPIIGKNSFYNKLLKQLEIFKIPIIDNFDNSVFQNNSNNNFKIIVDAIFGFSFKPPLKSPYDSIVLEMIKLQNENNCKIVAVDVPSGWDVNDGNVNGLNYMPNLLVSLTAPKPCSLKIDDNCEHYLGGRFIPVELAKEWEFEVPDYQGAEQCVKLK